MEWAEAFADGVRALALPGADVDDLGALEAEATFTQAGFDCGDLEVDAGGGLGVRVSQDAGQVLLRFAPVAGGPTTANIALDALPRTSST